jgi:hypothetical protein
VALSGDTALVGAVFDDVGSNGDQGSVYIFARSGTTWSEQAQLTPSHGAPGDRFGASVALWGNTALVGVPDDSVGISSGQGSAYFYDPCPVVKSIRRTEPSPTNAPSVSFAVTFSEDVTGVDSSDFAPNSTGSLSGASVTAVNGSGAAYTVTVSTGTGSGTLRLDVPATATITDLTGNSLSGLPYADGESYTVDKAAPTVLAITRTNVSPTRAPVVDFAVTFSEDVTGVGASDFASSITGSLSGASVVDVSGSGATYTVTVSTGSGMGTLRLDVPASATITDLAGNPLSALPYTSGEAYTIAHLTYLPLVLRTMP